MLKNTSADHISESYSEPSWPSNTELFLEVVKGVTPCIIFVKSSNVDVWMSCEYASVSVRKVNVFHIETFLKIKRKKENF